MRSKGLASDALTALHHSRLETAGKRQLVYNMIHKEYCNAIPALITEAHKEEISTQELKSILAELRKKGLIYCPKAGHVKCVDQ